jgi:DNA-binding PadR family transcriptional regulator
VTVDEALDELYGAQLEEFVAERKRLAAKLAGDEAKALATARKPNVAAWALNQLARRERRNVDLLLDAGHRMRQAQAGVLRGAEKQTFEDARRNERDALKHLTKSAERLLRDARGSASASALAQISEGLRAAAITEEGRELLARGRFVEPPRATGFDAFAGIDVPKHRPQRKPAKPKPDPRIRDLEQRLRAAERAAEKAETNAREARAAADALAAELRKLRG